MQSDLYNREVKEEFLALYQGNTNSSYRQTLREAKNIEIIQGTDLYNFNLEELSEVLRVKEYYTKSSVINKTSPFRTYIDWAIENGYTDNDINPLVDLHKDFYDSFVNYEKKTLMSRKEIEEVLEKTYNAQDRALIHILFNGGWGISKFQEVCNLKFEDVNWDTREITFKTGRKAERVVLFTKEEINDISEAYNQNIYYYNNNVKKSRSSKKAALKRSDYIFRPVDNKHSENKDNIAFNVVGNRIRTLAEEFNLELFTPQKIRDSGMLYYAHQLRQQKGISEREENEKISYKFDISLLNINGYEYPNATVIQKIVNEVNLERYYGENDLKNSLINDLNNEGIFNLVPGEGKEYVNRKVKKRKTPSKFKVKILKAYEYKCCVTNEPCVDVLEAAHIQPHINDDSDHIQNGLCLRADIHTLFDKGLITLNDEYEIMISPKLEESSSYKALEGKKINLPKEKYAHPSLSAIREHRTLFEQENQKRCLKGANSKEDKYLTAQSNA